MTDDSDDYCGRFSVDIAGAIVPVPDSETLEACVLNGMLCGATGESNYLKHVKKNNAMFAFLRDSRELVGIFRATGEGELQSHGHRSEHFYKVPIVYAYKCDPLPEPIFKNIILTNYYNDTDFSFLLSEAQLTGLKGAFRSQLEAKHTPPASPRNTNTPKNTMGEHFENSVHEDTGNEQSSGYYNCMLQGETGSYMSDQVDVFSGPHIVEIETVEVQTDDTFHRDVAEAREKAEKENERLKDQMETLSGEIGALRHKLLNAKLEKIHQEQSLGGRREKSEKVEKELADRKSEVKRVRDYMAEEFGDVYGGVYSNRCMDRNYWRQAENAHIPPLNLRGMEQGGQWEAGRKLPPGCMPQHGLSQNTLGHAHNKYQVDHQTRSYGNVVRNDRGVEHSRDSSMVQGPRGTHMGQATNASHSGYQSRNEPQKWGPSNDHRNGTQHAADPYRVQNATPQMTSPVPPSSPVPHMQTQQHQAPMSPGPQSMPGHSQYSPRPHMQTQQPQSPMSPGPQSMPGHSQYSPAPYMQTQQQHQAPMSPGPPLMQSQSHYSSTPQMQTQQHQGPMSPGPHSMPGHPQYPAAPHMQTQRGPPNSGAGHFNSSPYLNGQQADPRGGGYSSTGNVPGAMNSTEHAPFTNGHSPASPVVMVKEDLCIIGGFLDHRRVQTVEKYLENRLWERIADVPTHLFCAANSAVPYDKSIFLMGLEPSWAMHRLDLAKGAWSELAPMTVRRQDFATVRVDGCIYILGGQTNDDVACQTVEIYDIGTSTWRKGPSLLWPKFGFQSVAIGSTIYSIGGFNEGKPMNCVEMLDTRVGHWMQIRSMNVPRGFVSCAAVNESIFALGGISPLTNRMGGPATFRDMKIVPSCELFETRGNQWVNHPDMCESRSKGSVEFWQGDLWAVGGQKTLEDDRQLVAMEKYVRKSSKWEMGFLAGSTHKRVGHSSCVLRL